MFDDPASLLESIRERAELKYGTLPAKGAVGVMRPRTASTYRKTGGDRVVTATINTDAVDLDREVVMPGGAIIDDYMSKNGKVFVDHTYDVLSVVAQARRIYPLPAEQPVELRAVVNLMSDENPMAKAVRLIIEEAGGIGTSIGFEALDRGRLTPDEKMKYPGAESIVRKWRLLEFSFTAMPANPECQTVSMKSASLQAIVRKHFGAGADPILKAFHLWTPEPAKPKRVVVLS